MQQKKKPCYLKAVVIVHGRSEKQICEYIKSNLRLRMEIVGKEKGEKSIQINSLKHILGDYRFNSFKSFVSFFDDVEVIKVKKEKRLSSEFKIFIIMDTDDCTESEKQRFISKEMFRKHWAYEYIVPIYDSPDLENVMVKAGIKFQKKGVERKKEYIKIFPTDKKYKVGEGVELQKFAKDLKKVKDTNLDIFIDYCLNIEK